MSEHTSAPVGDLTSAYERALRTVSARVLKVTVLILACIVIVFAIAAILGDRFWVSWYCFGTGVLGGFVSIEQRLKKLSKSEVVYMASSWVNVLLVPFFAGIFALVAYLLFLSGLIEGDLFPAFSVVDFSVPATDEDIRSLFMETYPASGRDFAKLSVWTFIAGFSERFVPDIIQGLVGRVYEEQLNEGATRSDK